MLFLSVQKILLIQTAFLGDVILATPVISEMKRLFPQARIDALVKKGNEQLLQGHHDLNEVFVFDKAGSKLKNMFALAKQFRKTKYDLIINLHRFASSGIIAVLSRSKMLIGFDKNPLSAFYSSKFHHQIGNGKHEVERNLELIKQFGANTLVRPSLFPGNAEFNTISEFCTSEFVCIAPASVWFTKQLPLHKWLEVIKSIDQNLKIYLLGAPGDKDLCDSLMNLARENEISNPIENLAGSLKLMESAALISKAQHVYVNDSGPLHIASAMNTPVTAFFCSTIPEFGFGPLSDVRDIKQIDFKLECRPCGLHGYKVCPKGHFHCTEIKI